MGEDLKQPILQLRVHDIGGEAEEVVVVDLRDLAGNSLPEFQPGSHLEVYLPNGLVRHYSICNDSTETHRYCLGVALASNSRGGSRYIHEQIRGGGTVAVSIPRNNFHLLAHAEAYCFIAGGIGITPIMPMLRWCTAHDKPWELFYSARSRRCAAFFAELQALGGGKLHFHFDDEQGGRVFDVSAASRRLSPSTHVYCCGPAPLMNAVLESRGGRPEALYHFEWFSPRPLEISMEKPFTVIIRSSGEKIVIPSDRSILSVLEERGLPVPSLCREGLCGTCETGVAGGVPDHRDSVLTQEQRNANSSMMICVSRSKSDTLELEL